ncbi:uncharacterized protein LOC105354939 isoform X2 [Oryzias latipes]|uniref:uncharacterized protein LOC105354939 isoform X2 n=1 Tax=Oryzias latipes TaxID=8090 RepID=UPI0009DA57E3|nr:uncharacterized protein LOC105354939 isoform X2 [Oryzias latipes]
MSAEDLHKTYASVMESMLKSAVAETTKLFENMVNELKTEISQMRKENEDLKKRCIQIATADGHSRHSLSAQVDGDVSTKCDSAVQCDFVSDDTNGVEQCQPLENPTLQSAEYQCPREQIIYNLQEHNYVVPSNAISDMNMDVKQEELYGDSPEQSFLKLENVEFAVITGQKNDTGSKETPVCEAEHIGSTTAETQTKNEIDLQEAHNQTYDLQNSIVISLKDVFRGDIKEETESADETMARATGEQLSTSEIPNFNLQDSQPTINKSAVDDHRYTKGELAHSTKTIVNREVEEKGPEDCATETNCKPTSAVRGKRGRPPKKKRKQRKQAKSVSSKVLPVQPDLDDPLVKEKATKGFPIIYTEDSVTSQSSEMLQTELQPIQESSNTLVKSKKNTEVCYLPVSVECNGKGPKKQKPTESKKALVEVKKTTPIICGISSTLETSNTPPFKSLDLESSSQKECHTSPSLQDAILLVEAMNQSTVENTVPPPQNVAQSQTPGSAIKHTTNAVGQMAPKILLQPLKSLMLDASINKSATTSRESIIPKIIIVPRRNQTFAHDGVSPVTVLPEKALIQTNAVSQAPTQPIKILQDSRKTRIILVPRHDRGLASAKTTGVCPLKLSSFTMTDHQKSDLPENSTSVDLPLLPPSTSKAPKKTVDVCYKQVFPDVNLLTKNFSTHQPMAISPQLKKLAVESQAAPDKPQSLESPKLVVQSESFEMPESVQSEPFEMPESVQSEPFEMPESVQSESFEMPEPVQPESFEMPESVVQSESFEMPEPVVQSETSDMPESLEMPESVVQPETSDMLDSLEIPESMVQSESLEIPNSPEKPQQVEKQEFVDEPKLSEETNSAVFTEKRDTEKTTNVDVASSMQFRTTSQEVKLSCIDDMTLVEKVDAIHSSESSKQTVSPSKVANISTEVCSSSDKSAALPGSMSSTLSVPTKQNLSPEIRLTRLPFFVSPKETFLVSKLSSDRFIVSRKDKVGQSIVQNNSDISTSTASQKAHKLNKSKVSFKSSTTREEAPILNVEQGKPFSESIKGSVKLSVACNKIDSSHKPAMKKQPSKRSAGHPQSTSIPSKKAVDQLSISPMTDLQESCTRNADGAIKCRSGMEKSQQKSSIFSRLQSHLKAHMESKSATKQPSSDTKTTTKNSKKPRLDNDCVCDGNTSSGLDCSSKPDALDSIASPEKTANCQFSVHSRSVLIGDAIEDGQYQSDLWHHRYGSTSDSGDFRSNLDENGAISNNVNCKSVGWRKVESTKAKSNHKHLESVSMSTRHSVLSKDNRNSEFGKSVSKSPVQMRNETNPKFVKKVSSIQNIKSRQSPKKSDGEQVNPKSKKSESPTCDKRFNMDESFSTSDGRNQGSHSDKQTTEKCSSSERTIKKYKTKSKVLNDKQAKVTNSISPKRLVKKDQQGSTVVKKCIGKVWYPPTLPPNEMPSRETTKPPAKVKDKTPFEPFNKAPIVSPLQPLAVFGKFLLRNQCGVCGRVFSSSAALETHVSLHELNKPFSCSLCGKSFLDSAGLKRHGRVHRNGRIHVCHLCGKGFVYKFGLSKHLEMVHDKIKRFICQTCNKTFFTKRDVEIHIRSHTGETPFHCNLCERQFTSQVKLNVHLRWHNGEKRHWCPYCDKGFLDYNNLKRHKYIHTGERPCSCPYCPKNFTQIGHVRKHVRNVHKKCI